MPKGLLKFILRLPIKIFVQLKMLPECVLVELDPNILKEIIANHINETVSHYVGRHANGDSALEFSSAGINVNLFLIKPY